jgi:hypothetical protein
MKALPLMLVTFLLSVAACAQTSESFTNGEGKCSLTNSSTTYYCSVMQTYAPDGTFTGYLGLYFTVNRDGTFTDGHVYREDTHGNVVFTANNFSGTKVNNNFSGTFSGPNFSGSIDNETMTTKLGNCYKGTCRTVWYVSSGSGWYNLN